jgi:predicted dienelactone hydrolase
MRPWEWITVILLSVGWIALAIPAKKPLSAPGWLPLLPLPAAAAQWFLERYRWSMVPAYVLAALFFLIGVSRIWIHKPEQPAGLGGRIILGTAAVLALAAVAAAGALPALFPVFALPSPSGPYAVGITSFEWVDESRPEIFTPEPGGRRDLLVEVWYPAEPAAGAEPMAMWPEARTLGPQIAKVFGLPGFLFDQLALVRSHTYPEAPPAAAESKFPVLVFSHAYSPGFAAQNIVQMEELAGRGYVIFSIAHPCEASAVIYPDGRVVGTSPERYRAVIREGTVPAIPILKEFMAAGDPAEKERLFRAYLAANPAARESVRVWTEDTRFVMDQIERLERGGIASPLSGRLDLERMGVFGHSMGGVVAGEVCMLDRRCKAGVNMDGVQLGGLIDGQLDQPFMMMYSAVNAGQNDLIFDRFHNAYYRVVVAGTVHTDYCDFPLISPLFRLAGAAGSLDPHRMETILNRYLTAFFDAHLRGIDSPILRGPDPEFPEADVRVRKANR